MVTSKWHFEGYLRSGFGKKSDTLILSWLEFDASETSNFPVGCSGVRWDWNSMKFDGLGHSQSTEPVKWASTMWMIWSMHTYPKGRIQWTNSYRNLILDHPKQTTSDTVESNLLEIPMGQSQLTHVTTREEWREQQSTHRVEAQIPFHRGSSLHFARSPDLCLGSRDRGDLISDTACRICRAVWRTQPSQLW